MIFLLPPSESKTPASKGPKFAPTKLVFPELNEKRLDLMKALQIFCTNQPELAAKALDLGPKQSDLLANNAELVKAHCAPAIQIYTGVLYDHLGYGTLNTPARARADASILISSALFGFVTPADPIPAYRLSGGSVIPAIGSLAAYWKTDLLGALAQNGHELILDLRSGSYEKLAPAKQLDQPIVSVKVLTSVNGVLKPVTHFNKATKGDLVRAACLSSGKFPTKVERIADFFTKLGFTADLDMLTPGLPTLQIVTH
ncbi:MAG: peroxide stress protein YaaA [Actinomycetales bacterium]|nr:peroxide stress protein YaaA [Actinomycetales bacterium]